MEHTSRYSVELLASLSHSTVSLLSFLETHLSQAPKTISGSFRHTAGVDPTHTVVPTHTEPNALNSAEALQDDAGRVCVDDHCASRHTRHESAPPRRGSPSHLREALTFVRTPCAPSSTSGSSESSGGSLTVCGARGLAPAAPPRPLPRAPRPLAPPPRGPRPRADDIGPILLRRICFSRTAGLQGHVTAPNLQYGPFRANDTRRDVPAPIGRHWVGSGAERGYLTKPAARRS